MAIYMVTITYYVDVNGSFADHVLIITTNSVICKVISRRDLTLQGFLTKTSVKCVCGVSRSNLQPWNRLPTFPFCISFVSWNNVWLSAGGPG
jgi:hypothetical protein